MPSFTKDYIDKPITDKKKELIAVVTAYLDEFFPDQKSADGWNATYTPKFFRTLCRATSLPFAFHGREGYIRAIQLITEINNSETPIQIAYSKSKGSRIGMVNELHRRINDYFLANIEFSDNEEQENMVLVFSAGALSGGGSVDSGALDSIDVENAIDNLLTPLQLTQR